MVPRPRAAGLVARSTPLLVSLALVALVGLAYSGVGQLGFVEYDDGRYVLENPQVRRGLTVEGVAWALTSGHASNWHPLTWVSHMADVSLFGLDPAWHHRTSVAIHALSAAALFLVLRAATADTARSAVVAALFGIHPLNVESVAWVAQRKSVLGGLFWALAIGAHVAYVRRPGRGRLALTVAAFALGLLSKPTVVPLPLVLLLLDVWPLGRLSTATARPAAVAGLLREKLPLFVLAAAASVVTFVAQRTGGTVSGLEHLSLTVRLANAAIACASYLATLAWPASLAAFYPHPVAVAGGLSAGRVAGAALVLLAVSAVAAAQWRWRPFLAVGWLWFLLTLAPVIGIVQVGAQGMADRYVYLPSVGVFVAVVWLVPRAAWASRAWRAALLALGTLALLALVAQTRAQVATWRTTLTLFEHAARVTAHNGLAWKNVGVERYRRGEHDLALDAFRRSVASRPDDFDTWMNLAAASAALDRHAEVAAAIRQALRLRPDDPDALGNLVTAQALQGRWSEAAEALERLRRVDPARARALEATLGSVRR